MEINPEILRIICSAMIKLTELRQNECKHLCIENFAPEIFGKLIKEYNKPIQDKENAVIEFKCKTCGWKSYPGATIRQNKKGSKYYCPECGTILDAKIEVAEQSFILKNKR